MRWERRELEHYIFIKEVKMQKGTHSLLEVGENFQRDHRREIGEDPSPISGEGMRA